MRLSWTERALVDVANIDRWLSQQADPSVAMEQLDRVRLRARRLRDFPTFERQVGSGTRSVAVQKTPYILTYRVQGDLIEILRVHHNRQDWRPPE